MAGKGKKKEKLQPGKSNEGALERFCHNPSSQLSSISKDKPLEITSDGIHYKIMRMGLVPNDIKYTNNPLDANRAANKKAAVFNLSTIKKALKSLKPNEAIQIESGHGSFALVHTDVQGVDPALNVATTFGNHVEPKASSSIAGIHAKLQAFCDDPVAILSKYNETEQPHTFKVKGKEFKVVPAARLSEGLSAHPLTLSADGENKLDAQRVVQQVKDLSENSSITVTSEHGDFAIVHQSVELITPEVPKAADLDAAGSDTITDDGLDKSTDVEELGYRITGIRSVNGQPVEPEADPEHGAQDNAAENSGDVVDNDETPTETIEVADIVSSSFDIYKLSEFSRNITPEGKDLSAYDFVTEKKGISVVSYSGRKDPIGFMLPYGSLRGCDDRKGRWQISKFMGAMRSKWAADRLHPDIMTISNREKPHMTFITMGAALKLRQKGLFKNAPQWVKDHLNTAQAEADEEARKRVELEGIDTETPIVEPTGPVTPPPADEPKDPAAEDPETPVAKVDPEPAIKPDADKPEVPAMIEEDIAYSADNAIAAVSAAIKKAKETQALVKVNIANQNAEDIVHIGASEEPIAAMENVIELMKNMGNEAPEIRVIDYSSDMLSTMGAMNEAWKIANNSNSLVILNPAEGQRLAMTKNSELLQAYQMNF